MSSSEIPMRVLVTGAEGFIAKNLVVRLGELSDFEVIKAVRSDSEDNLRAKLANTDAVIHLAGENRPKDSNDFKVGNAQLTDKICELLTELELKIPMLFSSSTQATQNNDYGISKRLAETSIENYSELSGNSAAIYRLPGVFGKWCKPNYNSVVATFCYNTAHVKIQFPLAPKSDFFVSWETLL